jgi:hypothetical protein
MYHIAKEPEMKRVFMVLAAALIAFPIFAEQKKAAATPTPSAQKPTPSAERGKPSKEQRETALGGPDTAARGKPTKDQRQVTGKVISQSGKSFTVSANGKEITFSGAKLKDLPPKVGDTVVVTYNPASPQEAVTVKSSKSNSSE